ncbi:hypothetical protein [Methylorubrum aminovorans]|uniref:hypothetical protein n=1 Tax=Methylorubrum aminovorans TaxID=269069 RepID=UPI003C2BC12E
MGRRVFCRIFASVTVCIKFIAMPVAAHAEDPRTKFIATSVTAFVLAVALDRKEKADTTSKKLTTTAMIERFSDVCRQELENGTKYSGSDTRLFVNSFVDEKRFPLLKHVYSASSCEQAVEKLANKETDLWRTFVEGSNIVCAKASELLRCDRVLKERFAD